MAETQKKLLEAVINLFRPGTKESELLTTLKRMGADDLPTETSLDSSQMVLPGIAAPRLSTPPTSDVIPVSPKVDYPSGSDIQRTGEIAEKLGLEVAPTVDPLASKQRDFFAELGVTPEPVPKAVPGQLPKRITEQPNVITGEMTPTGPGPKPITASGSPPKDPLEDSVRSVSVIEDVTKPVKDKRGKVVRDKEGKVVRRVTNPGVETRTRELLAARPSMAGGLRQLELFDPQDLKGLSNAEIEKLALEQRAIQAAKNQAAGAPKATKIVEGKKRDQYGNPIKSTGNEPVSTTSPDEIFGEVGVGAPTGELIRGSAEVDQMLDAALKTPKTPPKTKAVGPVTAGMRKPDDIDFEGRRLDEEVKRIEKDIGMFGDEPPIPGQGPVFTGQRIKEIGDKENINAYIQDVTTRFDEMFSKGEMWGGKLGSAREQGTVASRLRDGRKKLSQLAAAARNPKTDPKRREEVLREIVKIDNWLTGNKGDTYRTLEDIKLDFSKGDIATENMPGTSVKQYHTESGEKGNIDDEFIDFIAPSKDLESSAFQRSADELSKQRMVEARQGPTIQRQLELYPDHISSSHEQLLQAARDRARMNPPGIVERMRPGEPTFEQSLMQTLREIQSMPSPQPNPNLALKPGTPINQELRERYKGRNIDPSNPIVMQLLRRAKRGTR